MSQLPKSFTIRTRYSAIAVKFTATVKLKEPSNIDELYYFLGLTDYYRKIVPLVAIITKPLNKLPRKNTKFQWSPQCQATFEHLKSTLKRNYMSVSKYGKAIHLIN